MPWAGDPAPVRTSTELTERFYPPGAVQRLSWGARIVAHLDGGPTPSAGRSSTPTTLLDLDQPHPHLIAPSLRDSGAIAVVPIAASLELGPAIRYCPRWV
jgi:hypothetical protein